VKEGDVVIVARKKDSEIRETESKGTVVAVWGKEVMVLLTDGNMWKGNAHEIYLDQEGL